MKLVSFVFLRSPVPEYDVDIHAAVGFLPTHNFFESIRLKPFKNIMQLQTFRGFFYQTFVWAVKAWAIDNFALLRYLTDQWMSDVKTVRLFVASAVGNKNVLSWKTFFSKKNMGQEQIRQNFCARWTFLFTQLPLHSCEEASLRVKDILRIWFIGQGLALAASVVKVGGLRGFWWMQMPLPTTHLYTDRNCQFWSGFTSGHGL